MKKIYILVLYCLFFSLSVLGMSLHSSIMSFPYSTEGLPQWPSGRTYPEPTIQLLIDNIANAYQYSILYNLNFVLPILILLYGAQHFYPSKNYGSLAGRLMIVSIGGLVVSMVISWAYHYIFPSSQGEEVFEFIFLYGIMVSWMFFAMLILALIVAGIAYLSARNSFIKSIVKAAPVIFVVFFLMYVSLLVIDYQSCSTFLNVAGKFTNAPCIAKKAIANNDLRLCEQANPGIDCDFYVIITTKDHRLCRGILPADTCDQLIARQQ